MPSYELQASLLVIALAFGAVMLVAGAVTLARDALERAPIPALVGIACTAVTFGSLFLERACGGTVNRPIITAVVGPDTCRVSALAAIELVVLLALGTSLAVRLRR